MNKSLGRRLTQVRRRLGPQVLELLRRGLAAQYLVTVRVATEARYDIAGSLGLRDSKLVQRLEVWRSIRCFLLSVEDTTFVESEILGVAQREPEEKTLHGPQLTIHPQVDAFDG